MSAAVLATLLNTAVNVTVVSAVTFTCLTANVADVFPAGTVTVFGAVAAAGVELLSATTRPLDGAGPLIVTVPVTALAEFP